MVSQQCTLCKLETPTPPVREENIEGVFCCAGCLHVYKLLEDLDNEEAEQLRKKTVRMRREEREKTSLPPTHKEAFFKVDGMHCTTCESFIETLAVRQEGIYKSEASYASEMVKIYYDADRTSPEELPPVLSRMGYRLRSIDSQSKETELNEAARLIMGGFFGILGLLLYSLFLYPSYLGGKGLVPLTDAEQFFFISNIFVMTSFILFYTGFSILRGALVSISVVKPNMDLLIAIAAVSSYLYSFGALLSGSAEVYFDVTMAIILVVSIGNFYEKKIRSGKRDLLANLSEKKINHAHVQRNGRLEKVSIADVCPGEKVIIKAGERIPVDGIVIKGEGVVNESLMTGEPLPVTKRSGDRVISGTVLTRNVLTVKADENSQRTIDKLMNLMWNIQSSRTGKQRLADRIAAYFVPVVILLGLGTFGYHLLVGVGGAQAMLAALAVLIVSCPCALGLATPLAIASGIRRGLEQEIIFKTAAIFEKQAEADIIAFDKTGTLTTGEMHLLDSGSNYKALRYAAGLEQFSTHPIAKPIANEASGDQCRVEDFQSYPTGVSGRCENTEVYAGQPEWLDELGVEIAPEFAKKIEECRSRGNIPVAVAWNGKVQSVLVVGDRLRDDAGITITNLKRENKKIAVITGDSERAGNAIRQKLQPDFMFTEAKPESKSNIIKELRRLGTVAMAGDGNNDAPALAEADLGIAFGDISAIAADSAQIVIPNKRLSLVPAAFKTIRLTRKRIRQNLGWALLYNVITIPLAIAGTINPLFAAAAMAASSLLVVGNSSRKMEITESLAK